MYKILLLVAMLLGGVRYGQAMAPYDPAKHGQAKVKTAQEYADDITQKGTLSNVEVHESFHGAKSQALTTRDATHLAYFTRYFKEIREIIANTPRYQAVFKDGVDAADADRAWNASHPVAVSAAAAHVPQSVEVSASASPAAHPEEKAEEKKDSSWSVWDYVPSLPKFLGGSGESKQP